MTLVTVSLALDRAIMVMVVLMARVRVFPMTGDLAARPKVMVSGRCHKVSDRVKDKTLAPGRREARKIMEGREVMAQKAQATSKAVMAKADLADMDRAHRKVMVLVVPAVLVVQEGLADLACLLRECASFLMKS